HTRFSRDWSSDVCSSDLNMPKFFRSLRLIVLDKRLSFCFQVLQIQGPSTTCKDFLPSDVKFRQCVNGQQIASNLDQSVFGQGRNSANPLRDKLHNLFLQTSLFLQLRQRPAPILAS